MNIVTPTYSHPKFNLASYPDSSRSFLESCSSRFVWPFWVQFKAMLAPESTNVTSINDARIICLPEMHFSQLHQERNGGVINCLYQNGDVILIEAPSTGTESHTLNHQVSHVKLESPAIRGWDLASADQAIHEAKEPFYKITREAFKRKPHHLQVEEITYLKSMIHSSTVEADTKKDWLADLEDLASGSGKLTQELYLLKFRIQREAEERGELGKVLRRTFLERQMEMIRVAKEALTDTNRVFIIAGAGHLVQPLDLSTDNNQVSQEGVDHLLTFLKQYPYVTLTVDCHP